MEITKHDKTGNTVTAEFKINAEELDKALEAAYHKKKRNISVPGFRKGKASRKLIEKQYGENVFYEDAVNGLYQKTVSEVIDGLGIDVVDIPETEVVSINREDGVEFKASFTVKPEVSIKGYLGLEVEEHIHEITDDEVEGRLKEMQLRGARIIDVDDRPAEIGDTVVFDFKGFCGGEKFEGGEASNYSLELGSGRFIPGFEEQIAGRSIGEDFDVNVTFPDDYQAKELAGKEALFKCKIHGIKGRELTELDDEFAKDVSEFDTLDELKEDIRKKLEKEGEQHSEEHFENELSEKLIGLVEADIPSAMFENRIDDLIRDWEYKNSQSGMNIDAYLNYTGSTMEKFRDMFREVAEKQVKMRLALEKIAVLENVEIEEEKISAEYEKLSGLYRMSAEKVRTLIESNALESDLKAERAMEIVKENAKKIKTA